VVTEFSEIKDAVNDMKTVKWCDLFTMGPHRNFHRVALGYINQVFQQISGCNLITCMLFCHDFVSAHQC
jgi:hypothetical protein